jgi:uncharacterized protein
MTESQAVVMGLLMLRGPQTASELRTSGERWYRFADARAVEDVLLSLQQRGDDGGQPTVKKLSRMPGAREPRWVHLLCGEPDLAAMAAITSIAPTAPANQDASDLLARITSLENAIAHLKAENQQLKAQVRSIGEQLGITLPDSPDRPQT